jgi:hypothetical protein
MIILLRKLIMYACFGHSKGSQRWPCLIGESLPFDKINMFARQCVFYLCMRNVILQVWCFWTLVCWCYERSWYSLWILVHLLDSYALLLSHVLITLNIKCKLLKCSHMLMISNLHLHIYIFFNDLSYIILFIQLKNTTNILMTKTCKSYYLTVILILFILLSYAIFLIFCV